MLDARQHGHRHTQPVAFPCRHAQRNGHAYTYGHGERTSLAHGHDYPDRHALSGQSLDLPADAPKGRKLIGGTLMKRITRLRQALWLLGAALLAAAVFLPIAAPARADEMGQNDVMFSGVLDSFSDDAWVVAGQALVVDSHTHIRLTAGPAEPGMWADVRATRQEDDSLLARQIVVRRPEVRLKGMVADKPEDTVGNWIIAGQTIVVNADTRISTRSGPVEEGRWVEVFAEESSNPTGLLALRIRAIRPQPAVEILGAIQAFAADSWTLSTIPLAVDAETLIAGEPQVSLLTHAAAELQDDGSLRALQIGRAHV